jgi:hypothetical protein
MTCSDWFSIESDCVIEVEAVFAAAVQVGTKKIENAKRK